LTHLSVDELHARYRAASEPVARSHWQIIWLLAQHTSTAEVAIATGYSIPWIRSLARRYNRDGPSSLGDQRQHNPGNAPLLSAELRAQLATLLDGPAPDGGVWSGPKVAAWMSEQLGRPVHPQRGWEMLRGLGLSLGRGRPRHSEADAEAQAAFKKNCPVS
jgi:transposase